MAQQAAGQIQVRARKLPGLCASTPAGLALAHGAVGQRIVHATDPAIIEQAFDRPVCSTAPGLCSKL